MTSCQIVHHVRWTCHLHWGASPCHRATVPPCHRATVPPCCDDMILQVLTRSVRAISHPLAQPTDHQGDHWSRNLWVWRRFGSGTSAHACTRLAQHAFTTHHGLTHSITARQSHSGQLDMAPLARTCHCYAYVERVVTGSQNRGHIAVSTEAGQVTTCSFFLSAALTCTRCAHLLFFIVVA
jgi:hypothetical protein